MVVKGDDLSQEEYVFYHTNLCEIRNMNDKVVHDPDFACVNHNVLTYRFMDYVNAEYGAGRRILKALADERILNATVIVSRTLGKYLGPHRFEIMNKLT